MAIIRDYYAGTLTGASACGGAKWAAQTFTASRNYNITALKLTLSRHATNAPGTITVGIAATTGGVPIDDNPVNELASGTTDGDTLSVGTSYELREIVLDTPVALTSGVQYAIIVRAAGVNPSFNWAYRLGGSYSGGMVYTSADTGGSWTAYSTYDFLFATYDDDDYIVLAGVIACVSALTGSGILKVRKPVTGAIAGVSGITGSTIILHIKHILGTIAGMCYLTGGVVKYNYGKLFPPNRIASFANDDALHNSTLIAVGFDADGLGIIYFRET